MRDITDAQRRVLRSVHVHKPHKDAMGHYWDSMRALRKNGLIEVRDGVWRSTNAGLRALYPDSIDHALAEAIVRIELRTQIACRNILAVAR